MEEFRFDKAIKLLWDEIRFIDQHISETKPWELKGSKKQAAVAIAVNSIRDISLKLAPFLPKTAEKISKQFKGPKIKSQKPLFPRLK